MEYKRLSIGILKSRMLKLNHSSLQYLNTFIIPVFFFECRHLNCHSLSKSKSNCLATQIQPSV